MEISKLAPCPEVGMGSHVGSDFSFRDPKPGKLSSCLPLPNAPGSSPGRSCPCSSSPSAPAPPHLPSLPPPASCLCSGPQQLPTPYPTTITTFVKNVYRFHPCTLTQIISSWPHILKDQGPRRSKSSGREGHTTTSAQQHIINVTCQIFFSTVN